MRLDVDPSADVQADAARLPFADRSFDAVISNHSLEHMTELPKVLAEIGRVLCPEGWLYIAVPDAGTFSDRLYRWVYHGGGHVNPFRSVDELSALVQRFVPLPFAGSRVLHTSFGFLLKEHFRPRPPRRMWLFANGEYWALATMGYAARLLDRVLHTRLSAYGWALYFGQVEVETDAWTNVCVRCGAAYPAEVLPGKLIYHCPGCGSWNFVTRGQASP